jgi:uncharacterized protein (TIGR02145 family)
MKRSFLTISTFAVILLGVFISLSGCKEEDDNNPQPTVTDIDGNVYHTVTIGTQVWMVENLKTTRCNDGTPITLETDGWAWTNLYAPGYCWYENDSATYKTTYGALYNWWAVNTGKLCPTGWHVPTDAEWAILTDYLGGTGVAGGKLKETGTIHWQSPNTGATNETGFTAVPGGYRLYQDGTFDHIGSTGYWWSSSEGDYSPLVWGRYIYFNDVIEDRIITFAYCGYSVRCIKDE